MIVWTGRGAIIVLIFILSLFASLRILPKELDDYSFVIAFFITAVFSWVMGKKWNNSNNKRILIDEKTGQKVIVSNSHTLFWIKMEYWGFINGVIGLVILFQHSLLWGFILSVVLLSICIFIYLKERKMNNEKTDNSTNHSYKKQDDTLIKTIEEPIETVEAKLKRMQEKEDPNRFMPK